MRSTPIAFALALTLSAVVVHPDRCLSEEAVSVTDAELDSLEALEHRILTHGIVRGVPRFREITDYYWDVNPELRNRFQIAKSAFDQGRELRAMTLVAGPAGIGKTFIKRHVYHDEVPRDQVYKFDIREVFSELSERGLARTKPDLHHGDRVFNRILSLTVQGREAFTRMLRAKDVKFLLVDSLDEIHPNDYVFVLNALESLVLDHKRQFVQVVVFGRPFAFLEYWKQQRPEARRFVQGMVLQKPEFQTTGDILVSDWNFDCWKFGLKRGRGIESDSMTFDDYQRWCENGFACEGEFANVCFEPNDHMNSGCREDLICWANDHHVIGSVLPNLAANGMVRQLIAEHRREEKSFQERRFMDQFLWLWLERDTLSDDRPSQIKPEHLEAYLMLLETIAAKHVGSVQVDGSFSVAPDEMVTIDVKGESICVPVRRVLNRSGLVTVNPFVSSNPRYRFEPFWFHRLLATMYQERHSRSSLSSASLPKTALSGR